MDGVTGELVTQEHHLSRMVDARLVEPPLDQPPAVYVCLFSLTEQVSCGQPLLSSGTAWMRERWMESTKISG